MENNLFNYPQKINLINKSFFLENNSINNYNQNTCLCQCECHKNNNISYNSNKKKIQIKKLNNNFFNLKLNQEILHKQISKDIIKNAKKEYQYNQISVTNNEETKNKNFDMNDFNIFINDLHKIRNAKPKNRKKKIQKSMSFKGVNINRNNMINNNKKIIYKNLNLNYYDNENENFFAFDNKKIKKNLSIDNKNIIYNNDINNQNNLYNPNNFTKRTCQIFSNNYIGNNLFNENRKRRNNKIKENDIFANNNIHNHKSVQINSLNNNLINPINYNENLNSYYNDNYCQKTNYIYKEKCNTNENNRINPLGNIVDNFVTMLKDKTEQRNKLTKSIGTKSQNYWYNKYNEDIMIKKRKLEDMCLSNNNKYKRRGFSNENNRKIEKEKNYLLKRNKNNMREMRAIYKQNNNILYDNFSFSNNEYFNNQASSAKNKKVNIIHNLIEENNHLNRHIKNKSENINSLMNNSFIDYIHQKKESLKNEIEKNKLNMKVLKKENSKNNMNKKNYSKEKIILGDNTIFKEIRNIKKKGKYTDFINSKKENNKNKFKIEKFNIIIQDTKSNTNEKTLSNINDNSFNNKSVFNQLTSSKFDKNIEIQNISNITYNPNQNILNTKEILDQSLITLNRSKNNGESVAEKVRKLIMKKASLNPNKLSLSTKLNLNTDLSLSESEKSDKRENKKDKSINTNNNIKLLSQATIFTIYYKYNKISILAFDYENKTFSFHDFSDLNNFKKNYKESLNNNNKGNLFLNINEYLYIITGKNYNMLYIYDSINKTMNKLSELKYNHSNGNLIYYENNLICLSGDYTKSVEIYYIKKNTWNNMPNMLNERSSSGVCILDNKYILNLFGYNMPNKKYLDNIEYLDMTNKFEPSWKCLYCNNFVLKIKNFFCFNNNNKIIIVGGNKYNENDKEKIKYNNNFIKIIFEEKNLDKNKNIKIEELIGKIKDINKNKNYLFNDIGKKYLNKKEIHYQVFDNKYNCHVFKGNNNIHEIFYSKF